MIRKQKEDGRDEKYGYTAIDNQIGTVDVTPEDTVMTAVASPKKITPYASHDAGLTY